MRLLVVGLDGATARVLEPAMARGLMPHLAAVRASGWMVPLRSTVPPLTAPAWATFMTGVSPPRHGVIDFVRYDPARRQLQLQSASDLPVPTLWERLSAAGVTVGVVNVPLTYPPPAVNGFLISGLLTPSLTAPFTYPAALAEEIRRGHPRYRIVAEGNRRDPADRSVLGEARDEFVSRADLVEKLAARYRPDVLVVQFQSLDIIQHRFWPLVLAAAEEGEPAEFAACLRALDDAVARISALAPRAPVLILSDHGFGPQRGTVFLNRALRAWGFAADGRRGIGTRLAQGVRRLLSPGERDDLVREFLPDDPPLLWRRSRASHLHGDLGAAIYLNVRGRDPAGLVDPGGPYERLREELIGRFEALTTTEDESVVAGAVRGAAAAGPGGPDLLVLGRPGWVFSRRLGDGPVVRSGSTLGTHLEDGVLLARGVPAPTRSRAALEDLVPTILNMLDVPVPVGLDGTSLVAASPRSDPTGLESASRNAAPALSPEEERAARLRSPGHLQ